MLISLEDKQKSNLHKNGREEGLIKIIIPFLQPDKYSWHISYMGVTFYLYLACV